MNLMVDLGNSRVKWAISAPGLWQADSALLSNRDMLTALDQVWNGMEAPQKVIVSNVAGKRRLHELEQWIKKHWSVPLHVIEAQRELLDVKNSYHEPSHLGADRWAALIAARGLTTSSASVVDCGTAITIDALSAQGEFLGGVIFPGLGILRTSLAQGTDGVEVTVGNDTSCLARSTADGVAAGTLFGLVGAIERILRDCQKTLGDNFQVFVTGGDAATISSRMTWPVKQVPDLVLKGLARIAETL